MHSDNYSVCSLCVKCRVSSSRAWNGREIEICVLELVNCNSVLITVTAKESGTRTGCGIGLGLHQARRLQVFPQALQIFGTI